MDEMTSSLAYVCTTSEAHAGASLDIYGDCHDPQSRADFAAWLDEIPADSRCLAFQRARFERARAAR